MSTYLQSKISEILLNKQTFSNPDSDIDTLTGIGNLLNGNYELSESSKRIINTIANEIININNIRNLIEIVNRYHNIKFGESQYILYSILKYSSLSANTFSLISKAPENAVPSEQLVQKILKEFGKSAFDDWNKLKILLIKNPNYQMQITCLVLAGLTILHDNK